MKGIIILLLMGQTMYSQSLENLQGQYLCEEDGFFHLYEFKERKLEATLNFKDLFVVKNTIFYTIPRAKSKDSIMVFEKRHEMERLIPLNMKDDKSLYDSCVKDCWRLWVLEKSEGKKLFIKIIPFHETLFKQKLVSDPNLIRHIILTPIKD